MRIEGEWLECNDGIIRPTVGGIVHGSGRMLVREQFLIDTGADRTVFHADLFQRLRLPEEPPRPGLGLQGVGGGTAFRLTQTVLELSGDDGRPAVIRGAFAAFIDPDAADLSILGRDVLDNFRLIVSRLDDEVLLLAPNHHYRVIRS